MENALIGLILLLNLTIIGITIYGTVVAFRANVFLGIVCIFLSPLAFVVGISKLLFNYDIAQKIMEQFNK